MVKAKLKFIADGTGRKGLPSKDYRVDFRLMKDPSNLWCSRVLFDDRGPSFEEWTDVELQFTSLDTSQLEPGDWFYLTEGLKPVAVAPVHSRNEQRVPRAPGEQPAAAQAGRGG